MCQNLEIMDLKDSTCQVCGIISCYDDNCELCPAKCYIHCQEDKVECLFCSLKVCQKALKGYKCVYNCLQHDCCRACGDKKIHCNGCSKYYCNNCSNRVIVNQCKNCKAGYCAGFGQGCRYKDTSELDSV